MGPLLQSPRPKACWGRPFFASLRKAGRTGTSDIKNQNVKCKTTMQSSKRVAETPKATEKDKIDGVGSKAISDFRFLIADCRLGIDGVGGLGYCGEGEFNHRLRRFRCFFQTRINTRLTLFF